MYFHKWFASGRSYSSCEKHLPVCVALLFKCTVDSEVIRDPRECFVTISVKKVNYRLQLKIIF